MPYVNRDQQGNITGIFAEEQELGQEFIEALPLGYLKVRAVERINSDAQFALSKITANYPAQEVATWPNQYEEAKAVTADPLAATPTLTAIASVVGIPVDALAGVVLAKAAAYTGASGAIVGRRKLLTAAIEAAATTEEVEAVTW